MNSPIVRKSQFVRLYKRGVFGNRSPTWDSVMDWFNDQFNSWSNVPYLPDDGRKFHLRNRIAGGATYYDLSAYELVSTLSKVEGEVDNYYVSEMAPTEHTVIQGEVCLRINTGTDQRGGLCLTYTKVRKPMRDALAEQTLHAVGLKANLLLREYVDEYEWLMELLNNYPDHVVEFSVYRIPFGTLNWKTVIWEVRKY